MSNNVLVITAHPLDHSASNSQTVAREFIAGYSKANPQDNIISVDVYNEYIPLIDKDVLSAWGALGGGAAFDTLTTDQQTKVARLGEIMQQFLGAQKYVFVSPLWNFSLPPMLKAYIDAITIVGKTFSYTEKGPQGLLTDKKVLHIQARGGVYSEGPMQELEMGDRYLNKLFTGFLGVPSYEHIIVEGTAQFPGQIAEIKAKAIATAQKLAQTF